MWVLSRINFDRRKLSIFIVAVMIIGWSSLVETAEYYVRTDGHDTSCNGSADASVVFAPNCAKRSIRAGIALATGGGDTVTIREGNYTSEGRIYTANNGGAGKPIIIQGYEGETVTLTSIRINHPYNRFQNLSLTNPGLSCDGSSAAIIMSEGNSTVSGMKVYGNNAIGNCSQGCPQGVLFENRADITSVIENSEFTSGYFHMVFIFHRPGTVRNNRIHDVIDVERIFDGIFTSNSVSDGTIIDGNEIFNYKMPGTVCPGNHPDIFQILNQGGQSSAHNWLIINNYFHDCEASLGLNEAASRAMGWVFRNNVFANIRDAMALLSPNTKVYNNTFFQVAVTQGGVMDLGEFGVEIINNVIIGANAIPTLGMINIQGMSNAVIGNNFFSLPKGSNYANRDYRAYNMVSGSGSINGGDPGFLAAYDNCVLFRCDFRIRADSPLRNAGRELTGFDTDKRGLIRPQGSAWDIGAYQFSPSDVLGAPRNLRIVY
mgnify:CR=1 FL=1